MTSGSVSGAMAGEWYKIQRAAFSIHRTVACQKRAGTMMARTLLGALLGALILGLCLGVDDREASANLPNASFVSLGVAESRQRVRRGDAFRWTSEYEDPFDLHEAGSEVITLSPGVWLVTVDLQFRYESKASGPKLSLRLDGKKHLVDSNSRTTVLRLTQQTKVSVVNEIGDDPANEPGTTFVVAGDEEAPRASEFTAYRLGDA